ncbi:MAG: TAXI family TRAP transporter solute-binding subunit [Paracoccus sp. (in: a-proteobacteria)]
MRNLLSACLVLFFGAAQAPAQQIEANILTGGSAGTYIQIGRDISAVAQSQGVNLIVNESNGSMENIYGVYNRPQTQLGIVQNDVLDFIRNIRKDNAELNRLADSVRLVMPLYNEEIHLVANPELQSLADLANARVSIGPENSGTQLTATLLLDALAIKPKAVAFMTPQDSLEAFLKGEVDAFFYVGGAPLKLLTDERLAPENARLLPLDDERLMSYYVGSSIPAGTYNFLTSDYSGVAVKSVLMTYEFAGSQTKYYKDSCDIVAKVTASVWENIDDLQVNGHPKWKSVNLDDIPPGWEKSECVLTGEKLAKGDANVYSDPADCDAITNPITRNLCVVQTTQQ